MEEIIHENKVFEKISFTAQEIRSREFLRCTFKGCDFSGSNFSYNHFSDCVFEYCNISLLKLVGTSLCNVVFRECKLLGVNFSDSEDFLFSVRFEGGVLDFSTFANKKMPKTHFLNVSMKSVDFTRANLQGSLFENTNLEEAVFSKTVLKDCNLLTAFNYTIDPESNPMAKARFSLYGVAGLLEKYRISIE
ncbi:pentapeptide repeat-containing protein [Williamwhitmania taraxaci]|uniref:Uncharacterized protein YjbI, contains pentapeptide repeats n=1 Tax=Williamwhitmania taraxaci TaxID=1640674 RepID=A0A1G6H1L4_9BACT|nr:pentapeptide repeat-containing protein [Williamwhitmania taraxaci]SDB88197.1 Uncharacterized protein YjbI, contains pentapeptide repeats [Williamwhitmania taraxaci]